MTDQEPSDRLRIACYHEAGHALIAYLEGEPIERVRASESGTGRVDLVDQVSAEPAAMVHIAHAGVAAESVYLGRSVSLDINSSDGELAFTALNRLSGNRNRLDDDAAKHVRTVLTDHPHLLDGLATFICNRHNTWIPWAELRAELDRLDNEADVESNG